MLRLLLFCLLFCVARNTFVSAQVYHYLPFNYSDPEINPSVIVSDKYYSKFAVQHANSFSGTEPFSISRFSIHKKLNRIFSGVSLTINNTNQGNRTYNHAALSYVYRNILFNSVFLRIGTSAKIMQNNAGSGYFDLFDFVPDENISLKQFSTNFNYNIAFTSSLERYYVSFSYLNHQPFHSGDTTIFPKYFLVQAGNLASLINKYNLNHVISFVYFSKNGINGLAEHNYYTNLFYALKINRSTTALFGGRAGFSSNGYYHFLPSLCLNKKNMLISLVYGFYVPTTSTIQFSSSFMTQINFHIPWTQNKYSSGVSF